MKKVACVIYPNFSLYEIVDLTSSLVLQYGIKVDYIAANKENILSEDGLICQATKTFDEVGLNEYSCIVLPGMSDFTLALKDELLIQFLKQLKGKSIVIAAISSAPILLAKAGLLEILLLLVVYGKISLGILTFFPRKTLCQKRFIKIKILLQQSASHIKNLLRKYWLL